MERNLIKKGIGGSVGWVVWVIEMDLFYEEERSCISGGDGNGERVGGWGGKGVGGYGRGEENGKKVV